LASGERLGEEGRQGGREGGKVIEHEQAARSGTLQRRRKRKASSVPVNRIRDSEDMVMKL
jgi:hypothetical protein